MNFASILSSMSHLDPPSSLLSLVGDYLSQAMSSDAKLQFQARQQINGFHDCSIVIGNECKTESNHLRITVLSTLAAFQSKRKDVHGKQLPLFC